MGESEQHGQAKGGRPRKRARVALALALVPALAAASAAAAIALALGIWVSAATGQHGLVRIGAAPSVPRKAVDLGVEPASSRVAGEIVLRPRDEAQLEAFVQDATRRGSSSFGHYLAPGQFAKRFGPAPATVAAVRSTLTGAGLQAQSSSADPLLVRFSGSAAAAGRAFATSVHRFRLPGGRTVAAASTAPAVPASVAGSVAAVLGLGYGRAASSDRVRRVASEAARFPDATAASFPHPAGAPDACGAARAAARSLGGLTDDEIANAYGAFGLYSLGDTGQGVHIGVFEEEAVSQSDVEHFDRCYFGRAGAAAMAQRLHVVSLEGGIPQGPGLYGEALLDVEDVSAMAPGAEIDVYENPESAGGEVAEIAAMVAEDRDQIITSSYGQACEQEEDEGQPGTQEALNYLFQQGAAQGQTFLGAAGDNGSDSCEEVHREPTPQPGQNPVSDSEIASQPYVVGVGGTTITDATQPVHEHVWNDGGPGGAGGGGISRSFAMPSWQRDATVPGIDLPGSADYLAGEAVQERFGYTPGFCGLTLGSGPATPCRLEPDVSAQADEYTGAVTVYSEQYRGEGEEQAPDGWITSGGTSSATPIWAGMLALATASPTCRENTATASGLGFMLPLLYGIASNPTAYAASFNDVTEGNNDQYGLDEGKVFPARVGYDLASGLGSPRMTGPGGTAGLAYYLCTYDVRSSRPVISALSPASGSIAGGEKVKISGSGLGEVTGVQVGDWQAPAGAVHLLSSTALEVQLPPARATLPGEAPAAQDGAGPVPIVVTAKDGESSATGAASTFYYLDTGASGAQPTITTLVPTGGSESAPATVRILGSGFDGASSVSFGGVNTTAFKVLSDSQIEATPPAYSSHTACAALPDSGPYAGESAQNDICQAQVVVHGPAGASPSAQILPQVEGMLAFEQDGALKLPTDCGCEVYPAPSEYDYLPTPQISSVSTSEGPAHLADENGGTLLTIRGTGLGRFGYLYASFGEPQLETSQDLEAPAYASGTEIQLYVPSLPGAVPTREPVSVPLTLRTLAGTSNPVEVRYAGVPSVANITVEPHEPRIHAVKSAPDTGGSTVTLHGRGLTSHQVYFVRFAGEEGVSEGTEYVLHEEGRDLRALTVSQNPGVVDVEACTASGCSTPTRFDELDLYPPAP